MCVSVSVRERSYMSKAVCMHECMIVYLSVHVCLCIHTCTHIHFRVDHR